MPVKQSGSGKWMLPGPKGPYAVGSTDLMTGYGMESRFIRLYYPIAKHDSQLTKDAVATPWCGRDDYIGGIGRFLGVCPKLFKCLWNWVIGKISSPAAWNAPLIGGQELLAESDESSKPPLLPVMIFSPGLAGFRSIYTVFCNEMASQGFCVASVEHRDGSFCWSYYYNKKVGEDGVDEKSAAKDLIPVPYDTGDRTISNFPFRNRQLNRRIEECAHAFDLVKDVNEGLLLRTDKTNGSFGLNRTIVESGLKDWGQFKGRLDMNNVCLGGHSFGSATVAGCLAADSHADRWKCGLLMDAWLFPVADETYGKVTQPMMFINMEKFQWKANIIQMERFFMSADGKRLNPPRQDRHMFTIRGAVHQSVSDMTYVVPKFATTYLGAEAQGNIPRELITEINCRLSLSFLRKYLGLKNPEGLCDVFESYCEHLIYGTNVETDRPELVQGPF